MSRLWWGKYGYDRDGFLVPTEPHPTSREVPYGLADEIYLHIVALDVDDEEAIRKFCSRYGVLGIRFAWYAMVEAFPGFERVCHRLERHLARGRRALAAWPRREYRGLHLDESLLDFQYGAKCIKDLVTAWRVLSGTITLSAASWASLDEDNYPASHDSVAKLLELGLTPALEPYHPRVIAGVTPVDGPPHDHLPLYSLCCLELFNHVAEEAVYRPCSHCGRLFVRQDGRSQHNQYRRRGKLKYCSLSCGAAARQKKLREKRKQVFTS